MAENLENLSGEDRIAALKAKMQASAKARAEESVEEPEVAPTAVAEATPDVVEVAVDTPVAESTTDVGAAVEAAPVEVADSESAVPLESESAETETAESQPAESVNGANGSSAGAPTAPPPVLQGRPEEDPEVGLQRQYSRREFLTYALGATTGLVLAETGLGIYVFMYPRFRAGEFGGKFFVKDAEWPVQKDAPKGNPDGKFWMVETEDGSKKAIYMVCTHLGCLYKWEPANWRFECPCHGSKFSHDGFYIEGPAPRSLDYFDLADDNGEISVDTGKKITGNPSSESPARRVIA